MAVGTTKKSQAAVVRGLALAGWAWAASAAGIPLEDRDFHSRVVCPTGTAFQKCQELVEKNSTIECPGRKAYAGFRVSDNKFHVWCEAQASAVAVKAIACPEGTLIQAGVGHLSSVWTLRCVLPTRELQGPFFEWYSLDGTLRTVTTGTYDGSKPKGLWRVENAAGKTIASGVMAYSPTSVDNGEKHGRWEEWSTEDSKTIVRYYVCGVPSSEADYLKFRRERADLADVCEGD